MGKFLCGLEGKVVLIQTLLGRLDEWGHYLDNGAGMHSFVPAGR